VPSTLNRKIAIKKIANLRPRTTPDEEITGSATPEGTKKENIEVLSLKAIATFEFETSTIIIKGSINMYIHIPLWMTKTTIRTHKIQECPHTSNIKYGTTNNQ
jgi:hypothetical protein